MSRASTLAFAARARARTRASRVSAEPVARRARRARGGLVRSIHPPRDDRRGAGAVRVARRRERREPVRRHTRAHRRGEHDGGVQEDRGRSVAEILEASDGVWEVFHMPHMNNLIRRARDNLPTRAIHPEGRKDRGPTCASTRAAPLAGGSTAPGRSRGRRSATTPSSSPSTPSGSGETAIGPGTAQSPSGRCEETNDFPPQTPSSTTSDARASCPASPSSPCTSSTRNAGCASSSFHRCPFVHRRRESLEGRR